MSNKDFLRQLMEQAEKQHSEPVFNVCSDKEMNDAIVSDADADWFCTNEECLRAVKGDIVYKDSKGCAICKHCYDNGLPVYYDDDSGEFDPVYGEEAVESGITPDTRTVLDDVVDELPAAPRVSAVDKIKGIGDKVAQIRLKRSMFRPYKRDKNASDNYGAGNVNKHLFKNPNSRVRMAMSASGRLYKFVKSHTLPGLDEGVRLLNVAKYPLTEFMRDVDAYLQECEDAVQDMYDNWDFEVSADLARITRINPQLADRDDYPTASEARAMFKNELRVLPMPHESHFLFDVSDDEKASLRAELAEVEANASNYIIEQLLEPLRTAIEKLSIPIGDDGAVFRDSLTGNIVDVVDRMDKANFSDNPDLQDKIDKLRAMASVYDKHKEALRTNQTNRDKTKVQIEGMVTQLEGLL